MADPIQHRISVSALQTEALVRNAIRYLDSPTDYRECLPQTIQPSALQEAEFVTLDDIPAQLRARLGWVSLVTILACIILLALLRI